MTWQQNVSTYLGTFPSNGGRCMHAGSTHTSTNTALEKKFRDIS